MKIITSVKKMQQLSGQLKGKCQIALVPSMGYLHDGHLSLVKIAKKKSTVVIVSIFVNPTQFGKNEDLDKYPHDLTRDKKLLRECGVDYLFIPSKKDMYPEMYQTSVSLSEVTKPLCGQSRPGHFSGVTTVVLKLFNIVQPDLAVFGKKDFQQLITIKTMVRDLNLPIKIESGKLVREKDGLALSSRNAYLSKKERELALSLNRALLAVKKACAQKNFSVKKMRLIFLKNIPQHGKVRVDYIDCLDARTLQSLKSYIRGKTLVACAVFVGKTRLIDNIVI